MRWLILLAIINALLIVFLHTGALGVFGLTCALVGIVCLSARGRR